MVEELVRLAELRGLTVRRETLSKGTSTGGVCVLRGVPTLFVDQRASLDVQAEVLSAVLRRFTWDDVDLAPAIRSILARQRS